MFIPCIVMFIRPFIYIIMPLLIGEFLVMSGAFFVLFAILICGIHNDKKRHYGPKRSTYIPKYRQRRMKQI